MRTIKCKLLFSKTDDKNEGNELVHLNYTLDLGGGGKRESLISARSAGSIRSSLLLSHAAKFRLATYRDAIYSLQILLSRTQAGPGRTVKQEQEEISPNHVQRINLISVVGSFLRGLVQAFA